MDVTISNREEDAAVTPPRTARKPPQTVPVDIKPPSESDPEDSTNALLPRKLKRRDPRPGVLITSPITEPISMDQDFQSPIVEEEVIPSEGAQALGSSFETPELDISKGKSKLLESEFVDDIRISELEKENSNKDSKISELQANLGGLTALFFDLKQRLFQKFGDEFQPLSAEGENITASSSGPANLTSQSSSERATIPALDANLDTFLSSASLSAQERREKQIRVEQLKGKMLVMKNSNQNAPGELEGFADEIGDKGVGSACCGDSNVMVICGGI
ncbi:unnamed protein product [Lactuca virosa]|uniref:Uncharacterized protein n=1 Tax=Lactuca virosa TaxID=75947 RepID=A0AAU9MMA5_9ASTR|nr:unnamed protein product [Lactuca virosa]